MQKIEPQGGRRRDGCSHGAACQRHTQGVLLHVYVSWNEQLTTGKLALTSWLLVLLLQGASGQKRSQPETSKTKHKHKESEHEESE